MHGHGGILLEHLKMLALHHDLGPGDRFFWFTTTGWMMWNFLVSGPAVGAAIVLFDGNPGYPDLGALWQLADDAGIDLLRHVGAVPDGLPQGRACSPAPNVRIARGRLDRRAAAAGGLPLGLRGGRHATCSCSRCPAAPTCAPASSAATPLLPVTEGVIACRCLGARVEAYDPAGKPVIGAARRAGDHRADAVHAGRLLERPGRRALPRGVLRRLPGRLAARRLDHHRPRTARCVITGRSDATLNRGGVRLGTAEFYSVVEALPRDRRLAGRAPRTTTADGELLLFVVLADGARARRRPARRGSRGELRAALSPRHVPDEIHQVRAVPRTLSGKKLEVPVKRILTGTPVESAAGRGRPGQPGVADRLRGAGAGDRSVSQRYA